MYVPLHINPILQPINTNPNPIYCFAFLKQISSPLRFNVRNY